MSGLEEEQVAGKARRRAGNVGRRRYVMTIAAVVLGGALSITLAPRSRSDAASVPAAATPTVTPAATPTATPAVTPAAAPNDDGVTWSPNGAVTQVNDGKGNCEIEMDGTVNAPGSSTIATIEAALGNEAVVGVHSDDINSLASYAFPAAAAATSLQVQGGASVDCSLVNQTDAYLKKTGRGSLDHVAGLVLDSYLRPGKPSQLPQWLHGAIGAIAGAIVYVVVSVVVVATAVALGAATTASGGLASPLLAAFAGCIGGATSLATQRYFAGVSNSVQTTLASALAGCLTGGLIARVPVTTTGVWIGQELGSVLGTAPAPIVGEAIVQDAAAAGVELSPISQAMQDAANALASP
jgi:hypothetical protein